MTTPVSPLPFFILGARDPEMDAIADLLRQVGAPFACAAADGRRVSAASAYAAEGVIGGWDAIPADTRGQSYDDWRGVEGAPAVRGTVWVECGRAGRDWPVLNTIGVCDHHRPTDPGYGRPPGDFLPGSSLGQVLVILARWGALPGDWPKRDSFGGWDRQPCPTGQIRAEWCDYDCPNWVVVVEQGAPCHAAGCDSDHARVAMVPPALVRTAALDHCPAAACRGECPGVDLAEALAEFAHRSGCTEEEVAEARAAILAAPEWARVDQEGQAKAWPHVRDLTGFAAPDAEPDQRGDRGALPGLRVAMMIDGLAALARVRMPDGREKLVLQGAGPGTLAGEEPVREFLAAAERSGVILCQVPGGSLRVVGAYGAPARGYAGAVAAPCRQPQLAQTQAMLTRLRAGAPHEQDAAAALAVVEAALAALTVDLEQRAAIAVGCDMAPPSWILSDVADWLRETMGQG